MDIFACWNDWANDALISDVIDFSNFGKSLFSSLKFILKKYRKINEKRNIFQYPWICSVKFVISSSNVIRCCGSETDVDASKFKSFLT